MALIWSADMETGDLSQWDAGNSASANMTLAASTSAVKTGSYGMRATANLTSDSNGAARANMDWSANTSNIHCLEFWTRIVSHTQTGYNAWGGKGLVRLGNDTANGLIDATARAAQLILVNLYEIQLAVRPRSQSDALIGSALTVTANTWYKMRLVIDQSVATAITCTWSYSTNGTDWTEQATYTDPSSSGGLGLGSTINYAAMGIVHINQWEKIVATIDIDEVAFYDAIPSGGGAPAASPQLLLLGIG